MLKNERTWDFCVVWFREFFRCFNFFDIFGNFREFSKIWLLRLFIVIKKHDSICLFHDSHILLGIIHPILHGYLVLYVFTIRNYSRLHEICPENSWQFNQWQFTILTFQLIKTRCLILKDKPYYVKIYFSHNNSFNIPLSI